MDTSSTQKRIAVISGGTGYVGFEVAKKLAEDGISIAVLYHKKTKEEVDGIVKTLKGDGHHAYACNLEDADNVKQTLELIEKEMGNIYACIHTAGKKPKRKQLSLSTLDDLKEQLDGNVVTGFNFLSACVVKLKEHKEGVMIGITTIGVILPEATKSLGAYIPAKYAIQGMLTMFKEELAPYFVRVYSVAPGFMEEGMNSDIPKAFVEMIKEKSPTKQITSVEDVSSVISKLCSDDTIKDFNIPVAKEYGLMWN